MSRAPMPDSASGETPMPSSFDQDLEFWEESRFAKLKRKLRQEPLVPLGLALTCYALYGAARSIRKGDKEQTNRYFRARVYAQAFTLVCVCAGAIYWKGDREQRKMYAGLLGEKRAREKRDAWIRELEARDKEDEVHRERRREGRRLAQAQALAMEAGQGVAERENVGVVDVDVEKRVGNLSLVDDRGGLGVRRLLLGTGVLERAMSVWWSRGG